MMVTFTLGAFSHSGSFKEHFTGCCCSSRLFINYAIRVSTEAPRSGLVGCVQVKIEEYWQMEKRDSDLPGYNNRDRARYENMFSNMEEHYHILESRIPLMQAISLSAFFLLLIGITEMCMIGLHLFSK